MNLEREILLVLQDLAGHLTSTPAVHGHVHNATGRSRTLGDVQAALESLERKGQVQGIEHEDFGFRWEIKDEGKARLRS